MACDVSPVAMFVNAVTVLAMVTAEICACVMRPASTIIHPVCSVGFIVNHIPNVLLVINLSIVEYHN